MQVFPSAKYKLKILLKYLTTWARLILEYTLVCWYSKARIFKNWFWKAKYTEYGKICERKFKPFLSFEQKRSVKISCWTIILLFEVSGNQFFSDLKIFQVEWQLDKIGIRTMVFASFRVIARLFEFKIFSLHQLDHLKTYIN